MNITSWVILPTTLVLGLGCKPHLHESMCWSFVIAREAQEVLLVEVAPQGLFKGSSPLIARRLTTKGRSLDACIDRSSGHLATIEVDEDNSGFVRIYDAQSRVVREISESGGQGSFSGIAFVPGEQAISYLTLDGRLVTCGLVQGAQSPETVTCRFEEVPHRSASVRADWLDRNTLGISLALNLYIARRTSTVPQSLGSGMVIGANQGALYVYDLKGQIVSIDPSGRMTGRVGEFDLGAIRHTSPYAGYRILKVSPCGSYVVYDAPPDGIGNNLRMRCLKHGEDICLNGLVRVMSLNSWVEVEAARIDRAALENP